MAAPTKISNLKSETELSATYFKGDSFTFKGRKMANAKLGQNFNNEHRRHTLSDYLKKDWTKPSIPAILVVFVSFGFWSPSVTSWDGFDLGSDQGLKAGVCLKQQQALIVKGSQSSVTSSGINLQSSKGLNAFWETMRQPKQEIFPS